MTADRIHASGRSPDGESAAANVLIVCTGNVCRSPFIERYLRSQLDPSAVVVSSAGSAALVGHPMDDQTAARASRAGADCNAFAARQLTADMVKRSDLVLTATRDHRARVVTLAPKALRYCFTVREFAAALADDEVSSSSAVNDTRADRVRHLVAAVAARRGFVPPLSDDAADIVDPYRQPDVVYDRMQAQIEAAMPPIIDALGG